MAGGIAAGGQLTTTTGDLCFETFIDKEIMFENINRC